VVKPPPKFEDKVQVKVYITKKTMEKVKQHIRKPRDLSGIFEDALEGWLERLGTLDAHAHVRMNPGFPRDKVECLRILDYLDSRPFMKGAKTQEFTWVQLKEAVSFVRGGSEKRTVDRWAENLRMYGYVVLDRGSGETAIFRRLD